MQASWPVACTASEAAAPEDGRSLDREALRNLRALLVGQPSTDSSVHPNSGQDSRAAVSDPSTARASTTDSAAPGAAQHGASAGPGLGNSAGAKQDLQAAGRLSSGTAEQRGSELQRGSGPEDRDAAQGAEWQLSSISQKALHGGRSRSSSLVRPLQTDSRAAMGLSGRLSQSGVAGITAYAAVYHHTPMTPG